MKLKKSIEIAQFNFERKYKLLAFWTNPFYLMRKHLYDSIKDYAPKLEGTVLDFGCGSKPYKDLFVNCKEYIGLDIEQSGHKHTKEDVDVYYDGHRIPFTDEYFDGVFSSEVIEHIENFDEILDELCRVLKPGGKMLMTTPFVWNENELPYDYARYTSVGLKKVLEKHGIVVIEQVKLMNYMEILYQMKAEYYRKQFEKFHNIHMDRLVRLTLIPICTIKGIILGCVLPNDNSFFGTNVVLCEKKL